jgi:hypothetical protein
MLFLVKKTLNMFSNPRCIKFTPPTDFLKRNTANVKLLGEFEKAGGRKRRRLLKKEVAKEVRRVEIRTELRGKLISITCFLIAFFTVFFMTRGDTITFVTPSEVLDPEVVLDPAKSDPHYYGMRYWSLGFATALLLEIIITNFP